MLSTGLGRERPKYSRAIAIIIAIVLGIIVALNIGDDNTEKVVSQNVIKNNIANKDENKIENKIENNVDDQDEVSIPLRNYTVQLEKGKMRLKLENKMFSEGDIIFGVVNFTDEFHSEIIETNYITILSHVPIEILSPNENFNKKFKNFAAKLNYLILLLRFETTLYF